MAARDSLLCRHAQDPLRDLACTNGHGIYLHRGTLKGSDGEACAFRNPSLLVANQECAVLRKEIGMNLGIVIGLIPSIIKIMGIAEDAFDDQPESGEQKKSLVIQTIKAIIEGVSGVSTGGQKETWASISTVIDPIIDVACSVLNIFGVFKKG